MARQNTEKYTYGHVYRIQSILLILLVSGLFFIVGCDDDDTTYKAPILNVISADYLFDQHGGNGIIITENNGSDVKATCEQSWVSSLSVNGTTVTFMIATNSSISSRVARIKLISGELATEVMVTQTSAMFNFENEYVISSEGGSILLPLTTELDYSVSINNAPWIKSYEITKTGIIIVADAVPTTDSRSTTATLTSALGRGQEQFTITQSGYDFGLYPTALNFSSTAESQSITVAGIRNYSVDVLGVDWLSYTKTSEGGIFTVTSNIGDNERTVTVVFTDITYGATTTMVVTQATEPSLYTDFLGDWNIVDYSGNTYTVTFTQKEKDKSYNMISNSFPGLIVEWTWSSANYGKILQLIGQKVYTYESGNIVIVGFINSENGSFYPTLGTSNYVNYSFNGSSLVCKGGNVSTYSGFQFRERTSANVAVGVYTGGPYNFRNTVLTKK